MYVTWQQYRVLVYLIPTLSTVVGGLILLVCVGGSVPGPDHAFRYGAIGQIRSGVSVFSIPIYSTALGNRNRAWSGIPTVTTQVTRVVSPILLSHRFAILALQHVSTPGATIPWQRILSIKVYPYK